MGQLQDSLTQLLRSVGVVTNKTISYPRLGDVIGSECANEVGLVFRSLGGLEQPEFRLQRWDTEFNGIAIELDEHLHFNRYRLITLLSQAYKELPSFPLAEYQDYCLRYEDKCLSAGGYKGKWTKPRAEVLFGVAGKDGELSGDGSPRWKQRAFYDFVRDLSPLVIGVRVVRISIWDQVDDGGQFRRVIDLLKSPSSNSAESIAALIAQRDV